MWGKTRNDCSTSRFQRPDGHCGIVAAEIDRANQVATVYSKRVSTPGDVLMENSY